ncbi:MAG: hypothetical protein WA061_02760 [Microgenomates group bacterium]
MRTLQYKCFILIIEILLWMVFKMMTTSDEALEYYEFIGKKNAIMKEFFSDVA